nr:hypothetical protein [Lachnospiraceae bacterium]
ATEAASEKAEAAEAKTSEAVSEDEASEAQSVSAPTVGLANPWVDTTEEEARRACHRLFKAPEGTDKAHWSMIVGEEDPSGYPGPLVQLVFTMKDYKDMEFTARAKQGIEEKDDLSGLYYDWDTVEDITLANWGEGNMPAKFYDYKGKDERVQLIRWYDQEIGIGYTLSTSAKDLEGFDLQAIAEAMYPGDEEYFDSEASDFLQEQSGKTEFKDYDEIISELKSGQGYATVKVNGADDEALLITKSVSDTDKSTTEASIYLMIEGQPKQMTLITGGDSKHPLRIDKDGIIYCGDDHSYETYVVSNLGTMMVKDYIDDGVNNGTNEITGFRRPGNDYEHDEDFTGDKKEFEKLIADRDAKPVIEFTVVK